MWPPLAKGHDWSPADGVLLLASAVGLCVVSILLVTDRAEPGAQATTLPLARLHDASRVRRRSAGTLVWDDIRPGERLWERDAIFVAPGGSASLSFDSGATLEVEERSLVVLESPEPQAQTPVRLSLVQGEISGSAGAAPVAVQASSDLVRLEPGAAARVTAQAAVELMAGRAAVNGTQVPIRAALVRLQAPERGERLYLQPGAAPVELRWDGSQAQRFSAQVARDRSFARRVGTSPAGSGGWDFAPAGSGVYYWRIADADGVPMSEVRKFVVLDDLPPIPYTPGPGDVILAQPGRPTPFWWTAVEGGSRYVVEIASDPAFRSILRSAEAEGPAAWVQLDLPEGEYHWRVRVRGPGRKNPPSSQATPFRLVARPIPDAPQLLDSAIEVEHGQGG